MRLLIGSLALLVAACAGGGDRPRAVASTLGPIEALAAGQPLPDAELPFLDGEGVLSTSELVGKPTVLNFWASWCAFCVDEMPDIQAVHEDMSPRVRFVGVDREDDREKALMLAERTGITYDLVADDDASFYRAVQARGMPSTLVVDADGVIVARHTGPIDAAGLRALLEEHLPDVVSTRGRGG